MSAGGSGYRSRHLVERCFRVWDLAKPSKSWRELRTGRKLAPSLDKAAARVIPATVLLQVAMAQMNTTLRLTTPPRFWT